MVAEQEEIRLSTAGFVSRFIALAIDATIVGVSIALTAFTFSMMSSLVSLRLGPRFDEAWAALAIGIGGTLFAIGYFVVCWSTTGKTLGKSVMGLEVVDTRGNILSPGRALLRFLCYSVSALFLFLGFFWSIWDRDRRTWHDMIVRSRVIYLPNDSAGHVVAALTRIEDKLLVKERTVTYTEKEADQLVSGRANQ
jgi:uncharacterized RDD family membrane protein YckC